MMFSTRSEYGLKTMVNLAKCYPEHKSLQRIAQEEHVPFKYLEKLARTLFQKKLVESLPGKAGGYKLKSHPKKYKVLTIIESLEGPLVPMQCAIGYCRIKHPCSSSKVWKALGKEVKNVLNKITLNDLIK